MKGIAVVVALAAVALFFYPGYSQLDEDLLVWLDSNGLNSTDVKSGLSAIDVVSRQDVVRLKKELEWWFVENKPKHLVELASFVRRTQEALEFENWLATMGIPPQHCYLLLGNHSVWTEAEFRAANASVWKAIFSSINAGSPCQGLHALVKQELAEVSQSKDFQGLVDDLAAGSSSSLSMALIGAIFSVAWRSILSVFIYVLFCGGWFIVVMVIGYVVTQRQHRPILQAAKDMAACLFIACLPVFTLVALLTFFRDTVRQQPWKWWLPRRRAPSSHAPTSTPAAQPVRSQVPSLFSSSFYLGNYLDISKCSIVWSGEDPSCMEYVVGSTISFEVQAFCRNGKPYAIPSVDLVTVRLEVSQHAVPHSKSLPSQRLPSVVDTDSNGTPDLDDATGNSVMVTFFSRRAGQYILDVKINGSPLPTAIRIVTPGCPDAGHSSLRNVRGCMAIATNTYRHMTVQLCDVYANHCLNVDREKLRLVVTRENAGDDGQDECCEYLVEGRPSPGVFEILYNIQLPGTFTAKVLFDGNLIQDGKFSLISLNDASMASVKSNMENRHLNKWYEARMLKPGRTDSYTSVYVYLLPKQVCIKEFYMFVIPRKLFAFRIRPSTKISCPAAGEGALPGAPSMPSLLIQDTRQGPFRLYCKDRDVVMATFAELLSRSVGGGESFSEKRSHFYANLLAESGESGTSEVHVDRARLLESAKASLTHFKGWKKNWNISFRNEPGLDYGGVSREFYYLLMGLLFNPDTGLFRRLAGGEDTQGLVHPKPNRPAHLKLDYYKFAGRLVGRCLLEGSRGHPMMIKAHFTRSFLAQLIGLRIDHTYFQTDDPELFTTKILYTLNNDVSDLEMVFAEEEYGPDNTVKVVPLVPGGENKPVTNDNKALYLDLLAEYRLGKVVKDEMEAFLKGLNDIVPDTLLSMFDENELELLLCGMTDISFDDLKKNSKLTSAQTWFTSKIIPWFWVVVSSFTQEELARLVQFTTGSSQLPPDGFAELKPLFQISPAPVHGSLPTAHTCFNQLCLPDYDSCEDLQRALTTAITEGSEGFQLL